MDSRGQPPPPGRNIEGGAVSLIGDFDRRPWAAYVFGHHSWTVRMWLELAWIRPGFELEDVWGNVPLAVEELQHARLVLASVIPPNVFELLDPAPSWVRIPAAPLIAPRRRHKRGFASCACTVLCDRI